MSGAPGSAEQQDQERVVVRDKRRLDPTSGAVRETVPGAAPAGAGGDAAGAAGSGAGPAGTSAGASEGSPAAAPPAGDLEATLAERTADLQRLKAEFDNYRKRVERDRLAMVEQATGALLTALLPLLDDIDRARQHGDLTGAFASVGEGLEKTLTSLGLERYGEAGEPFDPAVHEALMQAAPLADVDVPTAVQVLQPGYRLATSHRVLRPARVAVADPAELGAGVAAGDAAAPDGPPAQDA